MHIRTGNKRQLKQWHALFPAKPLGNRSERRTFASLSRRRKVSV